MDVEELIRHLGLQPLPGEGGLYRQSYRSALTLPRECLPADYPSSRPAGTAIYYLLSDAPDSFSALHRLPTDEIYHFYLGDPVGLALLLPGGESRQVVLGADILAGQQVQFTAPAGVWQGLRLIPGGRYALLGTSMAPGFVDSDLELGERAALLAEYPRQADLILDLTREQP